jgi:hypothetical protein
LADFACEILENYQAYTGFDSTELIQLLDMVDETQSMSVFSGNFSLSVSHFAVPNSAINDTSFHWRYVVNGVAYTNVLLSFNNGVFRTFRDDRVIYSIESTEVNVTKEQAIDIAVKRIENYSYTYGGAQVSGFNVAMDRVEANLCSSIRGNYVLFPCWSIILPLNQTYPGQVSEIYVSVWADTGEVFGCSSFTNPDPSTTNTASSEPSAQTQPENVAPLAQIETYSQSQESDNSAASAEKPSNMFFIGIATAATITAVIAAVVFIKGRHK